MSLQDSKLYNATNFSQQFLSLHLRSTVLLLIKCT